MSRPATKEYGISLVEMAIVLLIIGVLARSALAPLSAVQEQRQHREAVSQLESIRDALWAHVVSDGVLPCPLPLDGLVSEGSQSGCRLSSGGVPASRLGLPGAVDENGALLDPWSRPYQLAISLISHEQRGIAEQADWTTEGEASRIGIANLAADIVVCVTSVTARCPEKEIRANELVFVVFTLGADESRTGEQSENQDKDNVFVVQEYSVNPDHPFDDLLLWGTAAEAIYWMLRAGWLP